MAPPTPSARISHPPTSSPKAKKRRTKSPPAPTIFLRGFVPVRGDPEYPEARQATGDNQPYWFREERMYDPSLYEHQVHMGWSTSISRADLREPTTTSLEKARAKQAGRPHSTTAPKKNVGMKDKRQGKKDVGEKGDSEKNIRPSIETAAKTKTGASEEKEGPFTSK
ncbi:uncharacterized protein K460DRAFT_410458 [Cucurbitaria berberidis CBS 394.84]|uniref:Uncharacterized protein n=1 Tax=Cucurbitaria berberidis CBS 394.84 TaxID=1168544 RepID=A0A9P4G8S5_9PLEO|nr:uncharacterized protein K460DRAFT_410458 [Cucurbitaria berberidis CBS 394.84]KAF1841064.1 hypothetical protein K460DRAFT_410458 [Cucurbitaria berberidis CBS 394.84]